MRQAGLRGAASASTAIAMQAAAKNTSDSLFTAPRSGAPRTGTLKCSNMNQIEPQSAPRFLLKEKK